MNKSSFFTGQPVFGQILSFVPKSAIDQIANQENADRYCKHFTTHSHLVTMLYAIFNNCTSIRELTTGVLAWEQRIAHLGISHFPRRSTFSDANSRRSEAVFCKIYEYLYQHYRHLLPDSRKKRSRELYIADSSTISLFQEIMRNVGRCPANGKRKGGIKVHTLIRSDEDVPCLIRFTEAVAPDNPFLKQLNLPEGSVLVFDKGYNDYNQYQRLSDQKVTWVTRRKTNAVCKTVQKLPVNESQRKQGVQKDTLVVLGHRQHHHHLFVNARLILFADPQTGKKFQFITNDTKLVPSTIASFYKQRWQIETLFKRFKQNYPLRYFLGDSENAIKIQIWCALIADLLIKIIKALAAKRWSFSNLAGLIRIHLMTYINLFQFVKNPEKSLRLKAKDININLPLFPT